MRYISIFILVLILIPISISIDANANESKPQQCSDHFDTYEKHFNIPSGLLQKIANHESNAHPWTIHINDNHKSYFFKNKEAMVKYVSKLNKLGISNIDIGCMQINLYYHHREFTKLEHIIEPEYNIYYAAKLLKSHYNKTKDWFTAIAHYHSKNDIGITYAKKVLR
jgi:soluble lytic murein transglycosylase-like protein